MGFKNQSTLGCPLHGTGDERTSSRVTLFLIKAPAAPSA